MLAHRGYLRMDARWTYCRSGVIRLRGVDPQGSAGCLARRNTIYAQATKMTVVDTVSIAIFEASFLNRHFEDLDAGELSRELAYVRRDPPL
jgi:hypothetical protein